MGSYANGSPAFPGTLAESKSPQTTTTLFLQFTTSIILNFYK